MNGHLQSLRTRRLRVPSNFVDVIVTFVSKLGGSFFDDIGE
jgi:hypothetical protein